MTAIPCIVSVPAAHCATMKLNYTAISSTDLESKQIVTMTIKMPFNADPAMKKLADDVKNTDGIVWASILEEGGKTGWETSIEKEDGKFGEYTNEKFKCDVDQSTLTP